MRVGYSSPHSTDTGFLRVGSCIRSLLNREGWVTNEGRQEMWKLLLNSFSKPVQLIYDFYIESEKENIIHL